MLATPFLATRPRNSFSRYRYRRRIYYSYLQLLLYRRIFNCLSNPISRSSRHVIARSWDIIYRKLDRIRDERAENIDKSLRK